MLKAIAKVLYITIVAVAVSTAAQHIAQPGLSAAEAPVEVQYGEQADIIKRLAFHDFVFETRDIAQAALSIVDSLNALDISHNQALTGLRARQNAGDDDVLFQFAQNLAEAEEYYQAYIEFLRLIFYYPDSEHCYNALLGILNCYMKTGSYLAAAEWGLEIVKDRRVPSNKERADIQYLIALNYYAIDDYESARHHLETALELKPTNEFKDKCTVLMALAYASEKDWDNAEMHLAAITDSSPLHSAAQKGLDILQRGKQAPLKSPKLAAALNVVPGLGYVYTGNAMTASVSVFSTGLLAWGTYSAFKQKNIGLGILSGILTLGCYVYDISNAATVADNKNNDVHYDMMSKLHDLFDIEF